MCITIVWCVSNTRLFCKVSNNSLIIQVFDELAKDSIYRIEETDKQKDAEIIYWCWDECYDIIRYSKSRCNG